MNIKNLTDEQLQARHRESAAEIQRRHDLDRIPAQVRNLGNEWSSAGEDVDILVTVLSETTRD